MNNKGAGRNEHQEEGNSREETEITRPSTSIRVPSGDEEAETKTSTLVSAFDYDYDLSASEDLEETSFNKSKASY